MKTCMFWLTIAVMAVQAGEPATELMIGERLPELRGEFLTGRTALLPETPSGRVTLLLLGFTYDSRLAVEDWAKEFRAEFGDEPEVTFYEIPMIGGMARLGKWFIDSGMRRGTPKEDHERVITIYGGTGPWKKRVGYRDRDAAYLILLDQNGGVVWRYAGGFDEETYATLASCVSRLLAAD